MAPSRARPPHGAVGGAGAGGRGKWARRQWADNGWLGWQWRVSAPRDRQCCIVDKRHMWGDVGQGAASSGRAADGYAREADINLWAKSAERE